MHNITPILQSQYSYPGLPGARFPHFSAALNAFLVYPRRETNGGIICRYKNSFLTRSTLHVRSGEKKASDNLAFTARRMFCSVICLVSAYSVDCNVT